MIGMRVPTGNLTKRARERQTQFADAFLDEEIEKSLAIQMDQHSPAEFVYNALGVF